MKKRLSVLSSCCIAVLFAFSAFMAWYIPSMASIETKTADTRLSLETSRGRENKQQDEYDKAVTELPEVKEQLSAAQPQAQAAEEKVAALKARRKELRAEKQELEEAVQNNSYIQENDSHE